MCVYTHLSIYFQPTDRHRLWMACISATKRNASILLYIYISHLCAPLLARREQLSREEGNGATRVHYSCLMMCDTYTTLLLVIFQICILFGNISRIKIRHQPTSNNEDGAAKPNHQIVIYISIVI